MKETIAYLKSSLISSLRSLYPKHRRAKSEVGFLGGVILTFEHIVGEISPAIPFIGLILSALSFSLDVFINYTDKSPAQRRWSIVKILLFASGAVLCVALPHLAFFIGITATSLFLSENIIDLFYIFQPSHPNAEQSYPKLQKIGNLLVNIASVCCLSLSMMYSGVMIGLLGLMAGILIKYALFTCLVNDCKQTEAQTVPTSDFTEKEGRLNNDGQKLEKTDTDTEEAQSTQHAHLKVNT